jgi:hypothetical protein
MKLLWPLAGAICGGLGWFALIYLLSQSLSQYELTQGWKVFFIVVCPAGLILRSGFWQS